MYLYASGHSRSTLKKNASILPQSKFRIVSTGFSKFFGITRSNAFFRCEYDLDEIKAAADTDSYLRIVIRKFTELFFKSGYVFKSIGSDAPIEYLEKRFRVMSHMMDEPFDELMRNTGYDLIKFSNAFWIKDRIEKNPLINATGITKSEKSVAGYFRVDPASMLIKFDENGHVIGYKQIMNGKEREYKREDVIHFTFDRDPGSEWGTPRWIAAFEDIRILRKIEGDILSLIARYALPLFHAIVGLPQAGMGGTQKEIDETRDVIEETPPDGMLITSERVALKVVGSEGKALDMAPYLDYYLKRVLSALNASDSMMGRSSTRQDADSMEEQIHNAVKYDQEMFSIQFRHKVINELLMEGGFNPILNEEDIVDLVFNEISLDTKVKIENHEINKFQANAITFSELRNNLGMKMDNIQTEELYANMLQQTNELEQIEINHKNAMELARLTAQLSTSAVKSSVTSSSSKSSNYTKKNTGNGKTTNTARKNNAVNNVVQPKNQHGTFSAKIKESETSLKDLMREIKPDYSNWNDIETKAMLLINDHIDESAKQGYLAAMEATSKDPDYDRNPILVSKNSIISGFAKNNINNYFTDIKNIIGNSSEENSLKNTINSQEYRLQYLTDFIERKAYWYTFTKTCSMNNIKEVKVCCDESSKHCEHNGKILNTSNFELSEIPGYSSNCKCYLEPIENYLS